MILNAFEAQICWDFEATLPLPCGQLMKRKPECVLCITYTMHFQVSHHTPTWQKASMISKNNLGYDLWNTFCITLQITGKAPAVWLLARFQGEFCGRKRRGCPAWSLVRVSMNRPPYTHISFSPDSSFYLLLISLISLQFVVISLVSKQKIFIGIIKEWCTFASTLKIMGRNKLPEL